MVGRRANKCAIVGPLVAWSASAGRVGAAGFAGATDMFCPLSWAARPGGLPLFYDVHDLRCRELLLCALPPGDTIYGIVWKAYQYRARVIVLCCLEGVAAQGGWYLTNPVIHRALFVLRFYHRGWFPAVGWYISIRGTAMV